MAIYVEKNNAALLKSDRSVVELYKGAKKIFGYNYAKGKIVKVDDVHSTQHKLKVNLSSKNLIPYPYTDTTKTVNGITFTDNGDGTITANGTATGLADFTLKQSFLVKKGMCLSGAPEGSSYSTFEIQVYCSAEKYITTSGNGYDVAGEDFDLAVPARIRIRSGYTANNLVFKPLIEYNTIPTEYTPYISDFSGISVTKCGKNLINIPNFENIKGDGENQNIYTFNNKVECGGAFAYLSCKVIVNEEITASSSGNIIFANVTYADKTTVAHTIYHKRTDGTYSTTSKLQTDIHGDIVSIEITKHNRFTSGDLSVRDIQMEIGEYPTEYEHYITPQTVTANADGTVEGLTSISPNITLLTDTDGVVINCEYVKG